MGSPGRIILNMASMFDQILDSVGGKLYRDTAGAGSAFVYGTDSSLERTKLILGLRCYNPTTGDDSILIPYSNVLEDMVEIPFSDLTADEAENLAYWEMERGYVEGEKPAEEQDAV